MLPKCNRTKSLAILLALMVPVLISACGSGGQPAAAEEPFPTSVSTSPSSVEINLDINLPDGDPKVGLARAVKYRCFACHVENDEGLQFTADGDIPGIKERGKIRIADSAYQGIATNNQEYILESILYADIYLVTGDWGDEMPTYLADIMTEQDVADVLAWMETLE